MSGYIGRSQGTRDQPGDPMLVKLAETGIRKPKRGALLALLLLVVTGVIGGLAPQVLKARNDFEDPGSQSADARKQIEHATGVEPSPGVLAIVNAPPRGAAVAAVAGTLRRDPAV